MKQFIWIGGAFSILGSAVSLVRLIELISRIGLAGIPKIIVDQYEVLIVNISYYLLEIPFGISLPPWFLHVSIVYGIFVGSNFRFLTRKGRGEAIFTGIGDQGRGRRRGSLNKFALYTLITVVSLLGPLFSLFVFLMWLGNSPGPSGVGRKLDFIMIRNRIYSRRIAGLYLLILLISPIVAALLLVWNAVS